jgi:hypothetical protein
VGCGLGFLDWPGLLRVAASARNEQVKWQIANFKWFSIFHLPFAV